MSRPFLTDDMKSFVRRRVKTCSAQQRPSFPVSYNFARFANPEDNLNNRQEYYQCVKANVGELKGTYEINDDKTFYNRKTHWLNIVVEMVVKDTTTTTAKPTSQTKSIHQPTGDRN